ncbi:uncharacterized protein LOC120543005 isoform X1 [Polypterus senegalus]|uniref:uncharacterized protein LOC120543005 isoform X1 n=1 Tax=Polypterus senegalus TaxID=55291 RepID=UPI00196518F7|nr:uncharacterized protein LOC120543005 isoform X1 [Polypterus senegalus]
MRIAFILRALFILLFCLNPAVLEIVIDYPISLAYGEMSRFSTTLWLKPAFCFYEQWLGQAVDKTVVNRTTATIQIQVLREGDNTTYKLPVLYPVPKCNPVFIVPLLITDAKYQLGPIINCLNDSCEVQVLPNKKYKVCFMLYNASRTLLASTNWSEPLQTRGVSQDLDLLQLTVFRSGGMVVITVLLSIAMAILVISLTVAVAMANK